MNKSAPTKHEVSCGHCNETFLVDNYRYNKLLRNELISLFCNRGCQSKWQSEFRKKNREQLIKTCPYCKIEFNARDDKSKYCSRTCMNNSRITNIELECDMCSSVFTKKPSMKKKNNFCSVKCRSEYNAKIVSNRVELKCVICNTTYLVKKLASENSKCCSLVCKNEWLSTVYAKTEEGRRHLLSNVIKASMVKLYEVETRPEKIVREFLENNKIIFCQEYPMYEKFIVDFYLPETNSIIEVQGDYWHGNPLIYGENEGLRPLSEQQKRQKGKDRARFAYLSKCGHKVYAIWETDIYKDIDNSMSFLFEKNTNSLKITI